MTKVTKSTQMMKIHFLATSQLGSYRQLQVALYIDYGSCYIQYGQEFELDKEPEVMCLSLILSVNVSAWHFHSLAILPVSSITSQLIVPPWFKKCHFTRHMAYYGVISNHAYCIEIVSVASFNLHTKSFFCIWQPNRLVNMMASNDTAQTVLYQW